MYGAIALEWPYQNCYGTQKKVDTDVLIIGGGIAGCWAAIAAARKGVKVALLEKAATIRSGAGGAGCDHWGSLIHGNPGSKLDPEEFVNSQLHSGGINEWGNGIMSYIQAMESYETLLEQEQMGGKIRDTEDEFKGTEFRDENTKMLFAYDYVNKWCARVWGTTFKPALYKECKRLGVQIFDRVMATSILTEKGKRGARVIGATGVNVRTGEFIICRAKATIITTARPSRIWDFSTDKHGLNITGGSPIAWTAGAEFTMLEKNSKIGGAPFAPTHGEGSDRNTAYPCTMVDDNGKEVPWVDRSGNLLESVLERSLPVPGQKFHVSNRAHTAFEILGPSPKPIGELLKKGDYSLPFWADLPGMPDEERRVIWGVMVGEESKTKIVYELYKEHGFDPAKHQLLGYQYLKAAPYGLGPVGAGTYLSTTTGGSIRSLGPGITGGLVIDWNLKTSMEGLYAAGDCLFASYGHAQAATAGRYAGRNAAEYAKKVVNLPQLSNQQVEAEKTRVYAAAGRENGIDWKELNNGLNKVMQVYCGDPKSERLMKMGLTFLKDLKDEAAQNMYANNPHKLGRSLEVLELLTYAEAILHASLARKCSNKYLDFYRTDYPELDTPEWHKYIVLKKTDDGVQSRKMDLEFWGSLQDNYAANNAR